MTVFVFHAQRNAAFAATRRRTVNKDQVSGKVEQTVGKVKQRVGSMRMGSGEGGQD
jgi:hypothetical protein